MIIVGAGLSGIGAACHLHRECPGRSFAILEARDASGGTWDLFRYPGVRSDSDMHTLGYDFKPWTDAKAIADGPAILRYVQETARENGLIPDRLAYAITRWKNITLQGMFYRQTRVRPDKVKSQLLGLVRRRQAWATTGISRSRER